MAFDWTEVSDNHPAKKFFRALADRALSQIPLTDRDLHRYLSDLLLEFIVVDSLYKIRDEKGERVEYLFDMLRLAADAPRRQKKVHYKHIGDYSLFILGMYPESLTRGKRAISADYYRDTGRRSYRAASQLERDQSSTVVYRKLADKFSPCVVSLNWVRQYTSDPFYAYMLRQFDIT